MPLCLVSRLLPHPCSKHARNSVDCHHHRVTVPQRALDCSPRSWDGASPQPHLQPKQWKQHVRLAPNMCFTQFSSAHLSPQRQAQHDIGSRGSDEAAEGHVALRKAKQSKSSRPQTMWCTRYNKVLIREPAKSRGGREVQVGRVCMCVFVFSHSEAGSSAITRKLKYLMNSFSKATQ